MAEYKRQHYLPAVYLKNFSTDQNNPNRRSKIWQFNGQRSILVCVQSQCFENYCYSKREAARTEKMFQELEQTYLQHLIEIRRGRPLDQKTAMMFLMLMFDLHIRNVAYENLTGLEGIHAYQGRFLGLKSLLLTRHSDNPSDDEIITHLRRHWSLRVLS